MSDPTTGADATLAAELSRRIDAGELARGDRIEVGDKSFEVEGFDPFGADGRRVHVRTADGQQFTIRIPRP